MNAKKTILITAPYFPPQGGGLERYAQEIATRLSHDYGWRVVIVSSNEKRESDRREIIGDITIYRLHPDIRISNTPIALSWIYKLKKIITEERPDIINIHTPVPGLGDLVSLLARKIPQVVTYHTGSMKKGNVLDVAIIPYEKIILPAMLGRSRAIICSSDFVRNDFLGRYLRKSRTITPGVDCDFFNPDGEKDQTAPSLLFVAKLERGQEYKGLKTLLDAMARLGAEFKGIKLSVAGDGNLKKDYEDYAKKLGVAGDVTFLGALDRQSLAKAYRSSKIFILPTSNDSQPLVVLEAMASGAAIISTFVGGIPSMIRDGEEGILINPDEPVALAAKIADLLHNPGLRSELGQMARKKASEQFDWDGRLKEYDSILHEALKR